MIPNLLENNGEVLIGPLKDAIKGIAIEERNGLFEIELVYPVFSLYSDKLLRGNIIKVDANTKLKNQKFRIYKISKPISGKITVLARHISYDLLRDYIDSIEIKNQSCEYALNSIFRASQFCKHYVGRSDIIAAQDFNVCDVEPLRAIAGVKGSVIDTYGTGAELLRDNTIISVLNKRGHDNGVTIEYRKNLTGFTYTLDETGLITRLKPYAKYRVDNEEVIVYSNPTFIDSSRINEYETPFIKTKDFSAEFDENNPPTPEKLKALGEKYFLDTKCDIPKINYKIEFIPLSKCVGYEGLEDAIELCDLVTIKNSMYDITTISKVIKAKYDFLKDRYESMELGEAKTTLGNLIGGGAGEPGPPGPVGPQGPAGADGSMGDFPNSLPPVPQVTANVLGFASVDLSWTYENKPYYHYELYASKTENFEPNIFNLIFSGQASAFLHQVKPGETWYYKARALNSHSRATDYSIQVKAITRKVDDMENYFDTAAIGNAVIGVLTADFMTAGIIKGNWIDAKQLSVTDGNGKRTLDIDSNGEVNLDVNSLKIRSEKVNTEAETISKINTSIKEFDKTVEDRFTTANNNLSDLEGYMEGAFYDGVINASEAKSLRGLLNAISQDRVINETEFNNIHFNNDLENDYKKMIFNTSNAYNVAWLNYDKKLTEVIEVGIVTEEDKTSLNNLGYKYKEAIKNYKDSVTQCLDNISTNKVSKLNKTVTDKFVEIETENGEIKNKVTGIKKDIVTIDGEVQKRVTETSFTEFKQAYDNFKLNVTKNYGSKNLIKNSGFLNGKVYYHEAAGDSFDGVNRRISVVGDEHGWIPLGVKAVEIYCDSFGQGWYGLRQDSIKLKPNTKYTLAFSAASHRCGWRIRFYTKGWGLLIDSYGNSVGGKDPNLWDNKSITFTTGTDPNDLDGCRFDIAMIPGDKNTTPYVWCTNIMLVEGDYAPKWSPRSGETYSNTVVLDDSNFRLTFENGNYAQMGRLGIEQQIGNMAYPYHCLGWAKAVGIPAGNPGKVNVRLPDEFDHCEAGSINWSVAQRGYYYSTNYAFFPFYVQVEGARLFRHTDGHWYVEVHGYSRIQNAENPSDVQNMPNGVNAMITVNA